MNGSFGLFFSTVSWNRGFPLRLIALLMLVLAAASRSPAQSSATPPVGNKSDSSTKANFSQEPAIYEYVHVAMRYESDGSGTREVRSRIRVQTAAGLTTGGQLVFEYNAVVEQVEIRSVRVLMPDGSVVTAGPDSIQDLSAPVAREAPMYTDARQKHVTVPGVSVGDVVEFDVVTNAKPLLAALRIYAAVGRRGFTTGAARLVGLTWHGARLAALPIAPHDRGERPPMDGPAGAAGSSLILRDDGLRRR
jgi:hypothetical protein